VAEVLGIPVKDLHASKYNPRKNFASEGLQELAESIRTQGVISPLLVRRLPNDDDAFEIIAGERRWRAAKLAKLETVPCMVEVLTDQQAREAQVVENLQREDITPLEEAAGLQALFQLHGDAAPAAKVTVEDIAKRIGKSPRTVYARLQLLKLAPPVQKALEAGKLEAGHAQELVPLKPAQQSEMLQVIKNRGTYAPVSVQDLRSIIKNKYAEKPPAPKVSAKEKARRTRESAAQKKREAAYARQQAQSQAEQKRRKLINARAAAELAEYLRDMGKAQLGVMLDQVLAEDARQMNGLEEAWIVMEGKPLPDVAPRIPGFQDKFAKRTSEQRLALVLLAHTLNDLDWGPASFASSVFKWARVDRAVIARELAKQEREHAKADAAAQKKAQADAKAADAKRRQEINDRAAKARKVQTSAKRGKGKARKAKGKK
jgi:ParB family transcriptional regulator, chromosome partitioning protein